MDVGILYEQSELQINTYFEYLPLKIKSQLFYITRPEVDRHERQLH